MWRVFDKGGEGEVASGWGEEGEGGVAGCEGCGAEGDLLCWRGLGGGGGGGVEEGLGAAGGHFDGLEGGDKGWVEGAVKGGVDVPAVEAGVVVVVFVGYAGLVEGCVVWVLELDVLEAFVFRDEAVADHLDFGLVGDGFEVWVENGSFGVDGFAMAVGLGGGVEASSELCLNCRCDIW